MKDFQVELLEICFSILILMFARLCCIVIIIQTSVMDINTHQSRKEVKCVKNLHLEIKVM